jgi:hypothetical protein
VEDQRTAINFDDFRVTPEIERLIREARERRRTASISAAFQWMVAGMTPGKECELAAMPYKDFLQTQYWWVLGRYIRLLHGDRCDHCRSVFSLQVHHHTYVHVGSEYRHLEDLGLLCDDCHKAQHGR